MLERSTLVTLLLVLPSLRVEARSGRTVALPIPLTVGAKQMGSATKQSLLRVKRSVGRFLRDDRTKRGFYFTLPFVTSFTASGAIHEGLTWLPVAAADPFMVNGTLVNGTDVPASVIPPTQAAKAGFAAGFHNQPLGWVFDPILTNETYGNEVERGYEMTAAQVLAQPTTPPTSSAVPHVGAVAFVKPAPIEPHQAIPIPGVNATTPAGTQLGSNLVYDSLKLGGHPIEDVSKQDLYRIATDIYFNQAARGHELQVQFSMQNPTGHNVTKP